MKGKIFSVLTVMLFILSILNITTYAEYGFGYYIDDVKFDGSEMAYADIVFVTDDYGNKFESEFIGILAVYDDITGKYLNSGITLYDSGLHFENTSRLEKRQSVIIPDFEKERYCFKFIALKDFNTLTPVCPVSFGGSFTITNEVLFNGDYEDNNGDSSGSENDKVNEKNINPLLFEDFSSDDFGGYFPLINYYEDENATQTSRDAKIEAPFVAYMNENLIYKSSDTDTDSDVAEALNGIIGSSNVNKIITNNKNYCFVDEDKNGYYEKLCIENSATFVVGMLNPEYYEIYADRSMGIFNSGINFDGTMFYQFSPLSLDTANNVTYTLKNTNGEALLYEDIKSGDILTVKMSYEGFKYHYDITVSKNSFIEGTIEETRVKNFDGTYITYYKINGNTYRINAASEDMKFETGLKGRFYVTPDNTIISYELFRSYSYGVVADVALYTEQFSVGCKAMIMTETDGIQELKFAKRTYFYDDDGEICISTNDYDALGLIKEVISSGSVVIFEKNADDEISEIYLSNYQIKRKTDYQLSLSAFEDEYFYSSGKLAGKYIEDETIIVAVPDKNSLSAYEKYFYVDITDFNGELVYDGIILYNEDREAVFIFVTNLDIFE